MTSSLECRPSKRKQAPIALRRGEGFIREQSRHDNKRHNQALCASIDKVPLERQPGRTGILACAQRQKYFQAEVNEEEGVASRHAWQEQSPHT